jgi:hypothetical protein
MTQNPEIGHSIVANGIRTNYHDVSARCRTRPRWFTAVKTR